MSILSFSPDDGHLVFSIEFDRFDCEDFFGGHGRWQYQCTITYDGETIDAGPVRSGTTTQNNPEGLGTMLGSFLTFFSAFIEAGENGEHSDLFPESCKPLAEALDAGVVAGWADDVRRTIN